MTKILITGGSGLLGTSLIALKPKEAEILALHGSEIAQASPDAAWKQVDLTDARALSALISEFNPDVIIHAGSIGSVDFAEKNREISHAVNVGATRTVNEAAKDCGAKVIFISSNAVFDGNNPPYEEGDPTCPVNYYGELKVDGEQLTLASDPANAVIRPILMYGWPNEGRRGNLVTFWLSKLEAGEEILAVNDVWSKPLWVDDAAKTCWAVIAGDHAGIFNICGGERVTLHDLAVGVAKAFGHDRALVQAVPSSHFGDIANRPKDTSFSNARVMRDLSIDPLGIADGLAAMRDARAES